MSEAGPEGFPGAAAAVGGVSAQSSAAVADAAAVGADPAVRGDLALASRVGAALAIALGALGLTQLFLTAWGMRMGLKIFSPRPGWVSPLSLGAEVVAGLVLLAIPLAAADPPRSMESTVRPPGLFPLLSAALFAGSAFASGLMLWLFNGSGSSSVAAMRASGSADWLLAVSGAAWAGLLGGACVDLARASQVTPRVALCDPRRAVPIVELVAAVVGLVATGISLVGAAEILAVGACLPFRNSPLIPLGLVALTPCWVALLLAGLAMPGRTSLRARRHTLMVILGAAVCAGFVGIECHRAIRDALLSFPGGFGPIPLRDLAGAATVFVAAPVLPAAWFALCLLNPRAVERE